MCGIAGFWNTQANQGDDELCQVARNMASALSHRGPDDEGVWSDATDGIVLSHRRLSIIDLSPLGHQPMTSRSGRYIIVYNGEIYNFQDLRKELEDIGHHFKGGSDTEVLLAAIEEWGLKQSLSRCNGMFAFVLWDKKEKTLSLARDRLGKKPLYYGWAGNNFIFASELKAIRAHKEFIPTLAPEALDSYLRHNYVPAPLSIFKHIYKLSPASFLTITTADLTKNKSHGRLEDLTRTYWDLSSFKNRGIKEQFSSDQEAVEFFDHLLSDAIKMRMIADVPLGAFLSGGIDSSLITALMQKQSNVPIHTFSIGFEEEQYNEAPYAKEIANHLGCAHTEFYVSVREALNVIPALPKIFDEPFADPSQIPTYLLAKLCRQHVTVALSGDGGDEGFFGYNRYFISEKTYRALSLIPFPARQIMAKTITNSPLYNNRKGRKLRDVLNTKDPYTFYNNVMSYWQEDMGLLKHPITRKTFVNNGFKENSLKAIMQYHDTKHYLVDDVLVKLDRATMASGLEARAPLLDYRIFENIWRLSDKQKYRNKQGKWVLRQILNKYVPETMYDRPKKGFGIPLKEWLHDPLKDWAEDLIDVKTLEEAGITPPPVLKIWQDHKNGVSDWSYELWGLLMFLAWQREL